MFLLIAYLLLALVVSFTCSIMESVLLSTPKSYLMVKEGEGKKWAAAFGKMKDDVDKPLSAILSLNTVAHTIGAAGVGAQAVALWGSEILTLASVILTILILVITEIIPKTIGARYGKSLAMISYYVMRFMIILTYPLVLMSSVITRFLNSSENETTTSREEVAALASIGAEEGVFTEKEQKVIHNIIQLKDVKVSEIMTPRVVVAASDEKLTLEQFLEHKDYLSFSRIPIFSENPENITGYVFRQTVFEKLAEDQHKLTLQEIKREVIHVPGTIGLLTLWEKLLESAEHIAVIVDEYGGLAGIVTMEDILETLLGFEIVDEMDKVVDMQTFAKERWERRKARYEFLNRMTVE